MPTGRNVLQKISAKNHHINVHFLDFLMKTYKWVWAKSKVKEKKPRMNEYQQLKKWNNLFAMTFPDAEILGIKVFNHVMIGFWKGSNGSGEEKLFLSQ